MVKTLILAGALGFALAFALHAARDCEEPELPPRFAERSAEVANPARRTLAYDRPRFARDTRVGTPETDRLSVYALGCFIGRGEYAFPDADDCLALIDGANESPSPATRAFARDWLETVEANSPSPVREKAAALRRQIRNN